MAAPARPTGEVTFLFTDIEGSTRLVDALGTAAWRPLLAEHRAIVRAAVSADGGFEQGTEGDSFFVVFTDPDSALRAAVAAQRSLAAEPWPDGGCHPGPHGPPHRHRRARRGRQNYVGHDVHRAARVASAAHGGQVLLSEATTTLVEGHLPAGVALRDARRAPPQGPAARNGSAQLDIDGLPGDFPPHPVARRAAQQPAGAS